MKKTYLNPLIEIEKFDMIDVLTASDGVVDFNEDWLQGGAL